MAPAGRRLMLILSLLAVSLRRHGRPRLGRQVTVSSMPLLFSLSLLLSSLPKRHRGGGVLRTQSCPTRRGREASPQGRAHPARTPSLSRAHPSVWLPPFPPTPSGTGSAYPARRERFCPCAGTAFRRARSTASWWPRSRSSRTRQTGSPGRRWCRTVGEAQGTLPPGRARCGGESGSGIAGDTNMCSAVGRPVCGVGLPVPTGGEQAHARWELTRTETCAQRPHASCAVCSCELRGGWRSGSFPILHTGRLPEGGEG